jgi:hypothetical protein
MTTEQHLELLNELRAIRVALEVKPRPTQAITPVATASTTSAASLPPPDEFIEGAASVTVHFGKNSGVAIGSLTEKQLLWYGADREPRLKNDGTPFPPRAEDTLLKNACRTLWHHRKTGATQVTASKTSELASEGASEEVPF